MPSRASPPFGQEPPEAGGRAGGRATVRNAGDHPRVPREKLQQSGEAEEIGRAHTEYFLALAEEAEPELVGTDQVSWMDGLEAEHDNLRAALSRSLEAGDSGSALRIGGALWRFWNVRGHFSEGRRWLT